MTMVFAKLELKLHWKYHYPLILHEIQTIQRFSISALILLLLFMWINHVFSNGTELKVFHTTISIVTKIVGLSRQNSKFLQL